jgi:hypothetical protein
MNHTRLSQWIVIGACLATAAARAAEPKAAAGRKALTPAAEAALAGHLKDAFEEGFVIGPRHLQEALKHLNLARRAAPGDPRVDYAHGLVLLKQSQMKPAVAQFEAALKQDDGRYWPAWQAAIWGYLVDKQFETGLNKLDDYAEVVHAAEKPDEVSEAQRDAARWIGQLIEALTRCADSKKLHDLLAAHQVHLLETFGDELSEAVEAGRESIRDREFVLEQAVGTARQVADKEKERRKQDRSTRLDKDLEGLGKAKEDANKSAEEWKEWLDETLAKADKQLGLFERDYKFLEQRAQSLMQSITLVGRELTVLQMGIGSMNPRTTDPFTAQNAQFQLQQRQNQMFGYQLDYNATVGRMTDVAQQGSLLTQQRAEAVQRYEKETGQLVKKNADLAKWTARLKDEKQKLTVQKPAAKGGKKAAGDKKQAFTLKSYLPLEFDVEKERVLTSLAPPPKDDENEGKAAK